MSTTPPPWSITDAPDFGGEQPVPAGATTETKRACISCKRNKSRCDGGRPCISCLRKGYSPDQCLDGCRACRRDRLRCDGHKPCNNCQKLQRACLDLADAEAGATDSSGVAETTGTSTRMGERARLACLACRRDNKKCDNNRPCTRCLARDEECVHVEKMARTIKKRCQACRVNQNKCENARPCSYCVEAGIECVDVVRKGSGFRSNVKKACVQCRQTKIQCDEDRPCKNCVRRGLECITANADANHEEDSTHLDEDTAEQTYHIHGEVYEARLSYLYQQRHPAHQGAPIPGGMSTQSMSVTVDTNASALQHFEAFSPTPPSRAGLSGSIDTLNFAVASGSSPNWSIGSTSATRLTAPNQYTYTTPPSSYDAPSYPIYQEAARFVGTSNTAYAYNDETTQVGSQSALEGLRMGPAPIPPMTQTSSRGNPQPYDPATLLTYAYQQYYPEYFNAPTDEQSP